MADIFPKHPTRRAETYRRGIRTSLYLTTSQWSVDPYKAFNLSRSHVMSVLLTHLFAAYETSKRTGERVPVFIPMTNEFYRGDNWLRGIHPRAIRAAFKELRDADLVEVKRGRKGREVTSYWPSPSFASKVEDLNIEPVIKEYSPPSLIYSKLKDDKGRTYVEEVKRDSSRKTLSHHNNLLPSQSITYVPDNTSDNPEDIFAEYLYRGLPVSHLFQVSRCYIANQDERGRTKLKGLYGRLVAPAHWMLTKSERKSLMVNNIPLAEIDISSSQPRILHAQVGLDCPATLYDDLYPSNPDKAKAALTYCIGSNSPSWYNFNRTDEAEEVGRFTAREWEAMFSVLPYEVMSLLSEEDLWGLTSKIESDWLVEVMERHYDKHPDVLLLSWHDSLLIREDMVEYLDNLMHDVWEEKVGNLCHTKITLHDNNISLPSPRSIHNGSESPQEALEGTLAPEPYSSALKRKATLSGYPEDVVEEVQDLGGLMDVLEHIAVNSTLEDYYNRPITSITEDDEFLLKMTPTNPKDIT